jgi:hypothetical protein
VDERELLHQTADDAADFLATLDERPITPSATLEELRTRLGGPLPREGLDARAVIASLVEAVEGGLVGIPSGRCFGFVIGGAVRTTPEDVERSANAILRAAAAVPA